ncbi:hypothetical protein JB92DRAFT_3082865 [Gautieria morchelliformis]|nr:hypothetical protein JB92DRAFT_3082865 [Gautieria morchelliformis]
MSLDSFVKASRPLPQPVCTSRSIQDRESTFVATLFRASSLAAAHAIAKHVKNVLHAANSASHEMMAYRIMALKAGCTGLNGPDDFEVKAGSEDDGEKYGGGRILKVMQREGVLDAVVIVSRWFGGTLLGPVRFTHIENCTQDELEGYIERLQTLDQSLAERRATLAGDSSTPNTSKSQDYSTLLTTLDVAKARRLVKARESAIRSLEALLNDKRKDAQSTVAVTKP